MNLNFDCFSLCSISLLTGCFHQWREKLAEQRQLQVRTHFCRWFWRYSVHVTGIKTSQSTFSLLKACCLGVSCCYQAVVHEERCHLQRAFRHWKHRAEQQVNEKEKQAVSDHLYLRTLPHKTTSQWKDSRAEIRNRWNKGSSLWLGVEVWSCWSAS